MNGIRLSIRTCARVLFLSVFIIPGFASIASAEQDSGHEARSMIKNQMDSDSIIEKQGQYLSMAGNCHSCHTRPGGDSYAGGVPFNTSFGIIYSSNITPDNETGIGNWTDTDFIRAMHEGISANGHNLYPAFPYPSFTKISVEDVLAIYNYIKTLTPVSYTPPENTLDFPYNQRSLMSIWNMLYFDEGRYRKLPELSVEENRGAYLVQGLSHCDACHTPRNFLGGQDNTQALAGGSYLDEVEEGKIRPWSAINLTPGPGGIQAWTGNDIANYLKKGYNVHAATFGPMNKVIVNSTQYLSDVDLNSIGAYLKTLPPKGVVTAEKENDEDMMIEGQILYDTRCGTCHLPNGMGSEDTGTPLVGSAIVLSSDPASLINSILYGAHAPEALPVPEAWSSMKAFGNLLDNEEVAILSSFLRNSWGNHASFVTENQVELQR